MKLRRRFRLLLYLGLAVFLLLHLPDITRTTDGVLTPRILKELVTIDDRYKPPVTNKPVKVILVAYYRGGSTFLGQILNQNQQAFYLFEPFYSLLRQIKKEHNLPMGGDAYVPWNFTFRALGEEEDNMMARVAVSLLTCDFKSVPESILIHQFIAETKYDSGSLLKPFRECMQYHRKPGQTKAEFLNKRTSHWAALIKSCLPALSDSCNNSPIRGFKTIRMTMSQIGKVLGMDPAVRVVYSIRDPRGIASSRHKISSGDVRIKRTLQDTVKEVCSRMKNDRTSFTNLDPRIGTRIMSTSFEKILKTPVKEIRKMNAFLGVEETAEVWKWAKRQLRKKERGDKIRDKWRRNDHNSTWWRVDECKEIFESIYPNV